jgi:hypothetical protein
MLSVESDELLCKGRPDINFHDVLSLGSVYTCPKGKIIFILLNSYEHPSLVHSKIGFIKNDLVLILARSVSQIETFL